MHLQFIQYMQKSRFTLFEVKRLFCVFLQLENMNAHFANAKLGSGSERKTKI